MPTGFQAITQTGNIQIDGDTVSANLASIATVNTAGSFPGGYVTGLPSQSMIFHRSTGLLAVREYSPVIAGRYFSSNVPVSARIYCFNNQIPTDTTHAGMEVFGPSGNIIFSSAWRTLKIVDVFTINGNNPAYTGTRTWTVPNNAVVAMSTQTEFMLRHNNNEASTYSGGCSINGNTLTYGWIQTNRFSTWDDVQNVNIPYYYGYDSARVVNIIVAIVDYL